MLINSPPVSNTINIFSLVRSHEGNMTPVVIYYVPFNAMNELKFSEMNHPCDNTGWGRQEGGINGTIYK